MWPQEFLEIWFFQNFLIIFIQFLPIFLKFLQICYKTFWTFMKIFPSFRENITKNFRFLKICWNFVKIFLENNSSILWSLFQKLLISLKFSKMTWKFYNYFSNYTFCIKHFQIFPKTSPLFHFFFFNTLRLLQYLYQIS